MLPSPSAWPDLLRQNHFKQNNTVSMLLGVPLSEWRRRTRKALFGDDSLIVIMAGHQPEFFHPGVWAKFIMADRFARSCGGTAVHLITDGDAPKRNTLDVPTRSANEVTLRTIRLTHIRPGVAYEQIPPLTHDEINVLHREVSKALAERADFTPWPLFVNAILRSSATDWVDQIATSFSAVDDSFGLSPARIRASRAWGGPLLMDFVERADRFAAVHNKALRDYRRRYRIRGSARPMPDLRVDSDWIESPLWAFREGESRRRVFVARQGAKARLVTEAGDIGLVDDLRRVTSDAVVGAAQLNGWRLRPRALALTLWARLMLADLFIHGIGGAKYDEISDRIIADYYEIPPPHYVCVSATVHLGWPESNVTDDDVRAMQRALRDLRLNPHRLYAAHSPDDLIARRRQAAEQAIALRTSAPSDRTARRRVHQEIKALNREIFQRHEAEADALRGRIESARALLEQNRLIRGREYFLALYGRDRLADLLRTLPDEGAFRV